MARIRDPNRDKAFEIYKAHKGNIDLVEIANQLSVPAGPVRGWKAKDKWDSKLNGAFPKNTERSIQNAERSKPESVPKKSDAKDENEKVSEEVEQLDKSGLTDKQKLFCAHYIKCFNATKAYQKAYGVDYTTALGAGPRMLGNVRVQEEIQKLKQAKLNRVMLSPEDIFQKYMDIAFADITDYVKFGKKDIVIGEDKCGNPKTIQVNYTDFKESDEVDGSLISEIKQGKDGISVKLHDKMKAMQWLADRMDLLPQVIREKLVLEKVKVKMLQETHDKEMGANHKEPIQIEFMKASERIEDNESCTSDT